MYYSEMTALELLQEREYQAFRGLICEYRSPQFDGGTQQGQMIPCRKPATCWALGGGLRCEDHKGD